MYLAQKADLGRNILSSRDRLGFDAKIQIIMSTVWSLMYKQIVW